MEFLGKHTDYCGGRSLVCATEQRISVAARPLDESVLRITDETGGLTAELPLRADLALPKGHWTVYPATVARRLCRDFGPLYVGLDFSFHSDLPQDAGLSSSSALVTAVALALIDANALEDNPAWRAVIPTRETLAGYLGAVENGWAFGRLAADGGVGTQGGSQDHTAILCSRAGMLMQYGFDPVRFERAVPFPAGHVLVVAVSGVVAAKTREAMALYNGLAETAGELLRIWQEQRGGPPARTLYAAITGRRGAALTLRGWLAGHPRQRVLEARLDQFAAECEEIIPAVADLLNQGEVTGLGDLIDRSQRGAELGLGNQVPETIHLQRSARELGAIAASAFGAGFGGSVYALVAEELVEEFTGAWSKDYLETFPAQQGRARFITTRAGLPAGML
ncbi:MAG TPA: galactokinase family protein [Gemmatimonadales bacterium]|nr:galactokinase family protein [Gemmatimonadales bacterium]